MNKQPPPSIPFTKSAYEQMETEVEQLLQLRKEVLVRLQAAREMGDLSENGAYTYAKMELGNINRQLRQLRYLLKFGQVIEKPVGNSVVSFGSSVTVEKNGQDVAYTLVSIHESNLLEKKLSTESPLGAALMGKKIGDVVEVTAPAGITSYRIKSIQ